MRFLIPMLLLSAGCVIETRDEPRPRRAGQHGPNCADLIAAEGNSFDSGKVDVYVAVARRPGLTTHEQIHLVDAVMEMSFDNSKTGPLCALARNPCLSPEARLHLAERLRDLSFDASKQDVQKALLENPPKASTALVIEDAVGGVRVVSVDGSLGGLRVGDVVCAINDWPVTDRRSFENGLRRLDGKTEFEMVVLRDGARAVVVVKQ